MRRNDDQWFLHPTRQSAFAIVFIIFKIIKGLVRGLWPLLVLFLFRSDRYEKHLVIAGLVALGMFVIVSSILSYWRFYFYLDGTQLHVEKGVLRRSKLDIPFDRIQSISLQQPLLHRLFGLTQVKIDTAGSSGEEFSFNALSIPRAEVLKNFIQNHQASAEAPLTASIAIQESTRDQEIMHLEVRDLLKIGVSQNHFRTAGILFVFVMGLVDQIEDAFGDAFLERAKGIGEQVIDSGLVLGLFLASLVLIVAFLGTLVRTILRYYNFILHKRRNGYRLTSGLLNHYEQVVSDRKVQFLRWSTNPIKAYFGIVALRFFQASSNALGAGKAISVPGCSYAQLESIQADHFGSLPQGRFQRLRISRRLFIRRWIFLGWIPALTFGAIFIVRGEFVYFFTAVAWLAGSFWFQDQYQRTWQALIGTALMKTSSGVIERTTQWAKVFKMQGVKIARTPYQRRHGLASLVIYTASGKWRIPYLSLADAICIQDYLLYRVETYRGPWM